MRKSEDENVTVELDRDVRVGARKGEAGHAVLIATIGGGCIQRDTLRRIRSGTSGWSKCGGGIQSDRDVLGGDDVVEPS